LYADDLILLSAPVSGLQMCLNTVFLISVELQLEFNCKKSCCIAFGARYKDCHTLLQFGAQLLRWNTTVKYLGIVFSAGISLNVDTDVISRKFYAACNSIYSRTSGLTDLTKAPPNGIILSSITYLCSWFA